MDFRSARSNPEDKTTLDESVSGTAASVSGTAASTPKTADSVSGTAASVSGTAASVSGTAASLKKPSLSPNSFTERRCHSLRNHYLIVTVLCIKSILTMVYFIVEWRNWTAYTFSAILITITLFYALIIVGFMKCQGSNSIKVKQTSQSKSTTIEDIISLNYCTAFFLQFKVIFAGFLFGKLSLQYATMDNFPVWAMADILSDFLLTYSVACCVMTNLKEFGDNSFVLMKNGKTIGTSQESTEAAAAAKIMQIVES